MKSKLILLFVFLTSISFIQAQNYVKSIHPDFETQQATNLRLSILSPAFEAELKLNETASLSLQAWTQLGFSYTMTSSSTTMYFYLVAGLKAEPRFFVTMDKRRLMGRRTDRFSGGYVGLPLTIELLTPYASFGPVYGFQNIIGTKGFWRIEAGLGGLLTPTTLSPAILSNLSIGFMLN